MGKKVERDILARLQGLTAVPGAAGATGPAGQAGAPGTGGGVEISSWSYGTMLDARGSNGTSMDRFSEGSGELGRVNEWVAPRAGHISRMSGMLGAKITNKAMWFMLTKNGSNFTAAAVTVSSGQTVASISESLAFLAGDVFYMIFGGHESLAPFSATPFSASFEVAFS